MDFTLCPIQISLQIIILEEYIIFEVLLPKEYSKLIKTFKFVFRDSVYSAATKSLCLQFEKQFENVPNAHINSCYQ